MLYAPQVNFRYLYIDFNAFFAAVEQYDDPALRGRPVVVATTASDHACAIAVSYEARAVGLARGVTVGEARAALPGVTVRIARHDRYVAMHRALMAAIETCLPLVKAYSVDEAAFRLGAGEAQASGALAMGAEVKRTLMTHFGPALRSSIGLASTRLLAKIAAGLQKPDGLTVLATQDAPMRLAQTPLTALPGVGAGVAARLARAGVTDFAGLWGLAPKQARRIWGSVQGERFWYALHGYEVEEPATHRSMFGHSRVLNPEHRTLEGARIVARALLLKCASRLRRDGFFAAAVTATARIKAWRGGPPHTHGLHPARFDRPKALVRLGPDHAAPSRWERTVAIPATQDSFAFLAALDAHWAALADAGARRLGSVSVYLHSLRRPGDARVRQGDLLADMDKPVAPLRSDARKRSALWAAVDRINADADGRFARLGGARAADRPAGLTAPRHVTLATQTDLDLDYLGAKIAFSRVPDPAEFTL